MYQHPQLITSYRLCDLLACVQGTLSCPDDSPGFVESDIDSKDCGIPIGG